MKDFNKVSTHIVLIIDRSGSMGPMQVEGTNSLRTFIKDQKEIGDDAKFTLIQFDNIIDVVYDAVNLSSVNEEEYKIVPRGVTALNDAIGVCLTSERIAEEKVIVMIITDGHENASREYHKDTIKRLIEEKEKSGWEFVFLGANQDAVLSGGSMGVNSTRSVNYQATAKGIHDSFGVLSKYTTLSRTTGINEAEHFISSLNSNVDGI